LLLLDEVLWPLLLELEEDELLLLLPLNIDRSMLPELLLVFELIVLLGPV
jgi:hypothetical protein